MFPPVEHANEFGVVCWGGKLSPEVLLDAYSRGIFPWPHRGLPMLWFAPPERAILFVDELYVNARLRRALRQANYEIRFDTCFEKVIEACAAPRWVEGNFERGTWITKPLMRAFIGLHEMGFARSVEAWQDGELVGGLYGVSIGGYFAGESMFTNAITPRKRALWRCSNA
jgi:leucyl/phenylalanyl-tRNA--protein transferase